MIVPVLHFGQVLSVVSLEANIVFLGSNLSLKSPSNLNKPSVALLLILNPLRLTVEPLLKSLIS